MHQNCRERAERPGAGSAARAGGDRLQERYRRNTAAFSERELDVIRTKNVLVAGCGGLGGRVLRSLARFSKGG